MLRATLQDPYRLATCITCGRLGLWLVGVICAVITAPYTLAGQFNIKHKSGIYYTQFKRGYWRHVHRHQEAANQNRIMGVLLVIGGVIAAFADVLNYDFNTLWADVEIN